ncbi:hypothetical protein Sa4125_33460 [Aureimonas sp. SA4125]|uniref:DUF6680 family protein n=1 Tax=Aureimonas sp. SA4125 TaxID=2826993 RepID=UPI001CC570A8|nr:DUF6680 family protein [Aureimonas sp. SA4125]BDA85804.1 hypothetical protein Sa4125_33460 [Aureimonas sp. SA4125]
MNIDTWAVVLATALGPIAAVAITVWREERREKYARRLDVFRTLMSTRRTGISPEHVRALNLVEVDFFGMKSVEEAWRAYKKHLNTSSDDGLSWVDTKERLLADLLFQISIKLNFNIPALEIFRGGYAPVGWEYKENMQNGVLDYINDLASGNKCVPVLVVDPTKTE